MTCQRPGALFGLEAVRCQTIFFEDGEKVWQKEGDTAALLTAEELEDTLEGCGAL